VVVRCSRPFFSSFFFLVVCILNVFNLDILFVQRLDTSGIFAILIYLFCETKKMIDWELTITYEEILFMVLVLHPRG
jgi:hypothetical protein